jgi:hypothetical protein
MYSIRKHLRVGCATCSGLFIGRLSALTLHLAAIEAHERILAASGCESTAKPLSKDEARRIAAKWQSGEAAGPLAQHQSGTSES